jgi:hypothetical protein
MSRRAIDIDLDNPKIELWIGWDPGLDTFFFQAYDWDQPEEVNPVIWLGAAPPYFQTIDALLADLARIGGKLHLPEGLREELEEDQRLNRGNDC